MKNKPDPFAAMTLHIKQRPQSVKDEYLADWYIGVGKKRGWDEVVRLLAQNPVTEQKFKQLIKQRYKR